LTGTAAGKSTIADALDRTCRHRDGLPASSTATRRGGLCRDLGFTDSDRDENIRRVAEVARLMVEAGLIVIVALISPSSASRHCAFHYRQRVFRRSARGCPLETAEQRDPGLHKKPMPLTALHRD
jgi:adenylylsulfate kinase-like enzyme